MNQPQPGIRSLKVKNSLIIIGIMIPLLVSFLAYDLYRQTGSMRKALIDRGVILAQTGAETTSKLLGDAVRSGALTGAQIYDTDYKPIPNTYPQKYRTAYDAYTDIHFKSIQDAYLKDKLIVYAVAADINGYVPTHNTIYSQSGNDIHTNRTKRIFDDEVGLAAVKNQDAYLLQEYRRDTGEIMWDISAPVYLEGRHWGAFRIGLSMEETYKQIAAIRNQIIGVGATLTIALVLLVLYISHRVTEPVMRLEQEVLRVARGDFTGSDLCRLDSSRDELGNLTRSFCNMVGAMRQLAEKTRNSSDLVAAYNSELKDSIETATGSASVTAASMSALSETVRKMGEGAGVVARATERALVNLDKAGKNSEVFLKQMESSNKVMIGALDSVKELESYVEKVGDIISFIVLIADQASLLAKKAQEEAGRPGAVSGKFAALADEIQRRARDAAVATRGISSLFEKAREHAQQASVALENDQSVVLEGYKAAGETYRSLGAIIADLQVLNKLVIEVVAGAEQVSESITSLKDAAGE